MVFGFDKLERFFGAVLVAMLVVACGGGAPPRAVLPEGAAVLAFGDSITFGTGAQPGEGYPEQLAAETGLYIVNAGIPGDTAQAARGRIDAALELHQPALVILELGGNDFLRQRQAAQVREDLRSLIETIQASGAEVLLVAVPRLSLARAQLGFLEDSPIYTQLAEEEGVELFADTLSAILSDSSLRADRIHPNAAGYRQLAEALAEFLSERGWM